MMLKPCPFCGQSIRYIPYTRSCTYALRQGVIRCGCGVELRIKVYKPSNDNWIREYQQASDAEIYEGDAHDADAVIAFTKQRLCERWNQRACSKGR